MTEAGTDRMPPAAERGVGDIVKNIVDEAQVLIKYEVELAKAELMPSAKAAGKAGGMFGGAGVLALYALGLIFIGLSVLIGDALGRVWLGFLIMAVGLLVIAGILGLIGKLSMDKADFSATQTKASAQASVNAVKGALNRATVAAKTPALEKRHD
ncbi:phage holin family protein [Propionibacteriaceae bacterium Y2011]|uniref:phage holin family protein n=1 Tax=Microlunatus sp. Y2014 TaxID=3418488 RepID=UPI003B4A37A6